MTRLAHARIRALAGTTSVLLGAGLLLASGLTAAAAPTATAIDFGAGGYVLGDQSPAGQNGWVSSGGTQYDWALVDNTSFPAADLGTGRSLRLSNATGLFGNVRQLLSPAIEAPAGEPQTGASHDVFETSFTVASATGGIQEGLNVQIAVDGPLTGTPSAKGTRAGGVINLRHTEAGLQVWTQWPKPGGEAATLSDWSSASILVDADEPHEIVYRVQFVDGDDNDLATLWVDGVAVAEDVPSWEEYHDHSASPAKQVVDALLFRIYDRAPTAGGDGWDVVTPSSEVRSALDGAGFLVTDIVYGSADSVVPTTSPTATPTPTPTDTPTPTPTPTATPTPTPTPTAPGSEPTAPPTLPTTPPVESDPGVSIAEPTVGAPGETFVFSASGFDPYEYVGLSIYSTPQFLGWFAADGSGTVTAHVTLPASLPSGSHTLVALGDTSGRVAVLPVAVPSPALATTGADGITVALLGGVLLVGGLVTLGAARRTLATATPRDRR